MFPRCPISHGPGLRDFVHYTYNKTIANVVIRTTLKQITSFDYRPVLQGGIIKQQQAVLLLNSNLLYTALSM